MNLVKEAVQELLVISLGITKLILFNVLIFRGKTKYLGVNVMMQLFFCNYFKFFQKNRQNIIRCSQFLNLCDGYMEVY